MSLLRDATVFSSRLSTSKLNLMRISLISFLLIVFLASCEKQSESVKASEILECSGSLSSDSASLSTLLVGSWNWKYFSVPYTAIFNEADKSIMAEFKPDKTFIVKENSTVIAQGTWSLQNNGSYTDLSTSVINEYIGGPISICGDKLFFRKSFFDGSDHVFVKAN